MVIIRNSKFEELKEFSNMNKPRHVADYLTIKSLKAHQQEFKNGNSIFLSILLSSSELAGYIILFRENNLNTTQFKRILIDENYLGIGQESIIAMEHYCISELKIRRVWLDVFKNNNRAIHVYEKMGYNVFKRGVEASRDILFYEKML